MGTDPGRLADHGQVMHLAPQTGLTLVNNLWISVCNDISYNPGINSVAKTTKPIAQK